MGVNNWVMHNDTELLDMAARMRHHNQLAQKGSDLWQARKDLLAEHIQMHPANYRDPTRIREKYKEDQKLQDHMDYWNWHRREALRLATAIQTEYQLRSMNPSVMS